MARNNYMIRVQCNVVKCIVIESLGIGVNDTLIQC